MAALRRAYDATWGRLFAALYDRTLAATEQAGLGERRAELLAGARGRVLEIGAGTGVNVPYYTDAATELILTEPFEPMARQLRERVATLGREATVIVAPAERLPADDASVDTVVVTLVLCTVAELGAALAEIERVLAPGGRLLFLEHVRSGDPGLARRQDRLERPWRFLAHGCHPNRDTLAAIGSVLEVSDVEPGALPKSPSFVRPMVVGTARKPAA